MGKPHDVPTDLEWFHALDFSPDDLDEDQAEPKAVSAPGKAVETSGAEHREPGDDD